MKARLHRYTRKRREVMPNRARREQSRRISSSRDFQVCSCLGVFGNVTWLRVGWARNWATKSDFQLS